MGFCFLQVLLQDGKSERLTVRAGPNTTSVQDALTEYRVIETCPRGRQTIILSVEKQTLLFFQKVNYW